jgi:hypothetical protein
MSSLGNLGQSMIHQVLREGGEQGARSKRCPRISPNRLAYGESRLEPENRPCVDAQGDVSGHGHLVKTGGQSAFGRIVHGRRSQLGGEQSGFDHTEPGIVHRVDGSLQQSRG